MRKITSLVLAEHLVLRSAVLSQQQTCVLSQQQTSVLSQQQTSVLFQQKTSTLFQKKYADFGTLRWSRQIPGNGFKTDRRQPQQHLSARHKLVRDLAKL